ncbi:MAG TPA: hypothetical protein VG735_07940 [Caulobacterales bacterium]|nr:hypothetical protein [Caulobacterales bacterium]
MITVLDEKPAASTLDAVMWVNWWMHDYTGVVLRCICTFCSQEIPPPPPYTPFREHCKIYASKAEAEAFAAQCPDSVPYYVGAFPVGERP